MTITEMNEDNMNVRGAAPVETSAHVALSGEATFYAAAVTTVADVLEQLSTLGYDITVDNDSKMVVEMDPLLALVMAGIEIQAETNALITSLSKISSMITEATTKATVDGNKWLEDFYNHGSIEGDGIGNLNHTYEEGEERDVIFRIADRNNTHGDYYNDDQVYEMYDEISGNWIELHMEVTENMLQGDLWAPRTENLPEGYSLPGDAQGDYFDKWDDVEIDFNGTYNAGAGRYDNATYTPNKSEWTAKLKGPAATVKGPGVVNADTADMNAMIQMWQAVQSKVSQVNNAFQTVAAIPGTMLQSLQSSISTALSKMSSFLGSAQTRVGFLTSWAGV